MTSSSVARRRQHKGVSASYLEQCDYIVQSARKLYELQGIRKTSLADVAREANMTRELIYYYFKGKDDITNGVLDSYVHDAVDTVRLLCDTWETRDGVFDDLRYRGFVIDCVASIRRFAFLQTGEKRPFFLVIRELNREEEIISRISEELVREVFSRPMGVQLSRRSPHVDERQWPDYVKFLLFGTIGVMSVGDAQNDDTIADLLLVMGSGTD